MYSFNLISIISRGAMVKMIIIEYKKYVSMNYLRITILAAIILCISKQGLLAQTSPDDHVFQFFKTFKTKGSATAIDDLYKPNPWINNTGDSVKKLKNQLAGLTEDFVGKYYGYEVITDRMVGKSLLLKSYMVRFDRQPIRFQFIFYKPDNKWIIYSFQYDGSLSSELEEATQLFMLREEY